MLSDQVHNGRVRSATGPDKEVNPADRAGFWPVRHGQLLLVLKHFLYEKQDSLSEFLSVINEDGSSSLF
jgi:hypothetical protein